MAGPATVRDGSTALPLVGRDAELSTLARVLARAPALAVVSGEAGSGKTRLVGELRGRHEGWTATGYCQPLREAFPYGPVLDALRTLGERLPEPADANPVTGALAALLPELTVLPAAPPPVYGPAQTHRLFRAVHAVLAAAGPGVLVVEDLQWCDDGTRELLRFLLVDPPPELSVVLTHRWEDLPVLGLPCGPSVASARVELRPLSVADVRVLAGEPLPLAAAGQLHRDTGGLPRVLAEALAAVDVADLHGPGVRRVLDALPVPESVRASVAERLDGLEPDAAAVVQAAAVLGEPATVEVLGGVAGLPRSAWREAVVRALAATVLVEHPGGYGLRHGFARRAVYEALPGPLRDDLHVRAVRALRRLEPAPVLRLAEHSRRAGRLPEWLRYGEAAADAAAASADTPAAVDLLQRLLAEPLTARDVDRLALKLSRLAFNGLDQHHVTSLLQRLMADERLSAAVKGEIRLGLGLLLLRQQDGQQAGRTQLELAVEELHDAPDLAARAMVTLAIPYFGTVSLRETRRWADRADAVVDASTRPWRTTLLASTLGARLHTGDASVWRRVQLLPTAVDTLDERIQLARAHLNLADACSWTGHHARGREFLATGLRLAEEDSGAPFVLSTGHATQLRLDWHAGAWDGLRERASDLLATHADLLPVASELCLVLAWLAAARGDWQHAEAYLRRTGLATPENCISPVAVAAGAVAVGVELARGHAPAAVDAAERALHLVRAKGNWAWAGELAPAAARAYCLSGRPALAERLLAELREGTVGLDTPLALASVDVCAAEVAEHRGHPDVARDLFDSASRNHAALGLTYHAQLLAERAAGCGLDLRDDHAAAELTEVAEWFEEVGAGRDAARCRHVLREHGAACGSRRGRRGYGDRLSPREQDVAALLAGGRSNQEIADALFLSKRTVEQHVANVLRKLGLSSRRELSA